ncbi:MAG: hypothetical protein WC635_11660 [Bacteriovorax sp.]|jgi:hypothetical protein
MKFYTTLLALIISTSSFATSLTMKEGTVNLTFNNTLSGAKVSINNISILTECLTSYRGFEGIRIKNKAMKDSRITKPAYADNTEISSNDQKTISLNVNDVFTLTSPERKFFKDKSCTLVISGNIDLKNIETKKVISTTRFNLVYIETKENVTDALSVVNSKARDLTIGAKVDGKRAGTGEPVCAVTLETPAGKSLNLGDWTEKICPLI